MSAPLFEPPLSPVGCLALLWPLLSEDVVGAGDRAGLEAAAALLPPVPAIALELRLGGAGGAVDLHQLITRERLDLLAPWLVANPPRTDGEARLHRFLSDWAAGKAAHVSQVFLEWDRPADPAADPAPGVFIALDAPDARPGRCLEDLCGTAALDRLAGVRKWLPEGASINFLGIMLGRGGALRVNLRQIRPGELAPLLAAIGWPGDIATAERHFDALVPLCDRVAVALDFAPELQPTIGFELFLHNGPAREPRYGPLFDRIEALGLCAPSRRAALAGLDTQLLSEAEGQPWPAAWVIAAAARPDGDVPLLRVRLSHLKLSLDRHGEASAKAYVLARHQWSQDAAETPAPAPASRTRAQARAAALAFLLHEQGQDGLWRDFAIVNGASDHWVSAVVGLAVAPHARPAAERARTALLRAREPAQGWGYNAASPADADTSAWVLRFLRALDPAEPRAGGIEAFLARHPLAHGFTTYAPTTPIRFAGAVRDDAGWRGAHDCVAANAAGAARGELRESLRALLRESQRPEGHWRAYWWRTDILATALAIDALGPCEARRKALAWMRDQQAANDFDLAWQAMALRVGDSDDQVVGSALVDRLVAGQRADGGWLPGAEMLFPDPDRPIRSSAPRTYPDHRRLLTTASALMALEAWR